MGALPVHLGQDVKDEGLHIEVQCLVVQEKLGQQTQVLTVNLREVWEAGSGSKYNEPTEAWAGAANLLCKCQAGEKQLLTGTVAQDFHVQVDLLSSNLCSRLCPQHLAQG